VWCIAIACEILYRARTRLGLRDGVVIATAAAAYGVIRALLEIVRGDSPHAIAGALTLWQTLALAMSAGAIAWIVISRRIPSK
jgi:prolipoprotein diacylglyceryltransferase